MHSEQSVPGSVCSPVEQSTAAGYIISTPKLEYLVDLQQVGLHGATAEATGKIAAKQWQHKSWQPTIAAARQVEHGWSRMLGLAGIRLVHVLLSLVLQPQACLEWRCLLVSKFYSKLRQPSNRPSVLLSLSSQAPWAHQIQYLRLTLKVDFLCQHSADPTAVRTDSISDSCSEAPG